MARLIVQEGGQRREFQLGEGVLTVGSSDAARLVLSSPDVAAVHVELELRGERLLVRPASGVTPPTAGGASIEGQAALAYGEVLAIGAARLHIERDREQPVREAELRPATPASSGSRSSSRPAGRRRSSGTSARRSARGAEREAEEGRSPRRRSRGSSSGLVTALIVLAVVLGGVFIAWKAMQASSGRIDPALEVRLAEEFLRDGDTKSVREKLDRLPPLAELDADLVRRIEAMRARLVEIDEQAERRVVEDLGQRQFDKYLETYESRWLRGSPSTGKIRLFLERCREFRNRFPEHSELEWVDRQEARFSPVVDLAQPAPWEDVLWIVDYETNESLEDLRDYRQSLLRLAEFEARAAPEEAELARARRADLIAARDAHFLERMNYARQVYEKYNNHGESVEILAQLIMKIGDPAMEDEAARYFVKIEEVSGVGNSKGYLAGYQRSRPYDFIELTRNTTVRALAQELGLL